MDEIKETPIAGGKERQLNTEDPRFRAMFDSMQRIDDGTGGPSDVETAVNQGAAFYGSEAAVVTGPQREAVVKDADRLRRFQEAGHYGQLGFCADYINWLYDEAMRAHMNNAPKTAVGFIKRAGNWEKVLQMVKVAPTAGASGGSRIG